MGINKLNQRIFRNLYNESVTEVDMVDGEHIRLHFGNGMVLEIVRPDSIGGEDEWSIIESGWLLPEYRKE